jgi:hypothetical protein
MNFKGRTDSYTAAMRASEQHLQPLQPRPSPPPPSHVSPLAAAFHSRDHHVSVGVHSGLDRDAEEGNRGRDNGAATRSPAEQVFVNVLPSSPTGLSREGEGATQDTAINTDVAQEMLLPQDCVDFNGATFGRNVIQVSV